MPLEVIALNAAAAALFEGAKSAAEKGKQLHDDYRRKNKYSEEIDDLATELYDSFERTIGEKAQQKQDQRLKEIADSWAGVSRTLDEEFEDVDLFFEDEDDAVQRTAEVIAHVYAETEDPDQELVGDLEDAVREGYRDSLRDFQKSVRDTELERDLREEYDINVVDKLNEAINLLGSEHYELFDSASTGKAKEEVFRQGGVEADLDFVERPEIDEVGDNDKLLVTGRKGTGKTRVLARLLEEYSDDVDEVVLALDSFQNPNDVSSLESERFDGDVLLVWDDIHGISEEDNIFRDSVSKLEKTLGEDDHRLMVLATARAEEYENLPRINRWKEDRVWSEFERLEFRPLEEEQAEILEGILEKAIDEYDVDADEEVKDQLLQKAYENDPSPFYVVTVIQNTDEELTYERVEELPEEALVVWEGNYSNLEDSEKKILQVIELLSEVRLPYHSLIVEELYSRALDKDGFGGGIETLVTEHWVVNSDLDRGVSDDELTYRVHDICVEAVADSLSELEVEDISDYLLENEILYLGTWEGMTSMPACITT